jgi:alpha-D-xyloside xylohydrolase
MRLGGLEVHLGGAPPELFVLRQGETVFETATELPFGKLPSPAPWGSVGRGVTWPLRFVSGERIYGAGEFFGPLNHIGQELRTSVADVFGLPNDATYVTYPFFWSTRGYAFLAETWAPVRLDFGRRYLGFGEVEVPETPVTIRLFFSRSPREILRWFWDRRGTPAIPPLWSYGVWYSRCAYRNQGELLRVARRVRSLGLPGDVIHLDPPWLDEPLPDALYAAGRRLGLSRAAVDRSAERDPGDALAGLARAAAQRGVSLPFFGIGCTFRWNRRRFPDPSGMIRELHARRFRLSLWINPYVPTHTPEYRYLNSRDLLVHRGDGKVGLRFDRPSVDFGAVDFSQVEGRRWFAARVAELVRLGVDVLKTDFGEAIPEDGYGRAISALEMHNRYATLYPETVFRAVRDAGGEPMVWGRSGGLDIHRYPIQWGGDPRTYPRDMAAALRGALSYAASGGAFTSFDSGGFGGRPSPELYVRWMQMGMLFSHTRLHGTTPREPWYYGPRALAIFRKFSALRYRLLPYLYSQSVEGIPLGRPLVRPIVVDYPDDAAATSENEYLLGEHLLVVPVIPGDRSRVVLPRGDWFDFWTGHGAGPELPSLRRLPLGAVPIFVRSGAVVATTARDFDHTDPSMLHDLVLRTYGPVRSATLDFGRYGRLRIPDLRRPRGRSGPFRWTVERVAR